MEEIDLCCERAINDQRKMLRDRYMALDALCMNSYKDQNYNSGLDLLGARKNSVNGIIVQRIAAADIEALIANNLPVVMDVLQNQHNV
ncbi:MAG: hypothetical protein EZS28_012529 [Streblomastix strix]|uniref:Uncharacterized protein n=1 Tax=Streblomastix strix TaxID=222440 RepID=A0A5J4WAG0_9EUKA|nr:MAG: hypothetical protein EZS28_012529 [Streblomastix strix]